MLSVIDMAFVSSTRGINSPTPFLSSLKPYRGQLTCSASSLTGINSLSFRVKSRRETATVCNSICLSKNRAPALPIHTSCRTTLHAGKHERLRADKPKHLHADAYVAIAPAMSTNCHVHAYQQHLHAYGTKIEHLNANENIQGRSRLDCSAGHPLYQ